MPAFTDEYGLQILQVNDDWTINGYKFSDADRRTIARLLKIGAETHHHTGEAAVNLPTTGNLTFTVTDTAGSVPADTDLFYRFTLVDEFGFESAQSAEYTISTAPAIQEPGAVQLARHTTGGNLLPGNYYYVATAYTNVNTQETRAISPAYITISGTTVTNRVVVTLPSPPAGADGWNIYRKKPGGARYDYLTSLPIATTSFNDTGAIEEDCNRTIPDRNRTNAQNTINVTLAGTTLPAGVTWKLYRSYNQNYENSTLHHVVEETFEGSGIITQTYQDTGIATTAGTPPSAGQAIGTPDKILITDAAEIQGKLPMGLVAGYPSVQTFYYEGQVNPSIGEFVFPIMWPDAKLVGVQIVLGQVGGVAGTASTPNATPVIVDVNLIRTTGTAYAASVFTTAANRPTIPVGQRISPIAVPDFFDLNLGDLLTIDIDQAGGGTGTDRDMTIALSFIVGGYSQTVTYTGATPTLP